MEASPLSSRFDAAFLYAHQLHASQVRKGIRPIPYISHLLAVAGLVLEAGGSEDEAIAALLHDAVEDQGGYQTLAEIRQRFGEPVAAIVEGCSDAFTVPKPPWRQRKEAYLDHLLHAPNATLRVALADKLHNARTVCSDLRQYGDAVWERFTGGRQGTLWYYRRVMEIFQDLDFSPMVNDLAQAVREMHCLAGEPLPPVPAGSSPC